MKILIISNGSSGLYKFRKELIQQLIHMGYEVHIATRFSGYERALAELGCKLTETSLSRRGINPFIDLKLFMQYVKIITQLNPDKVITYTIKPNIYGGIACRFKRIPLYANITGLGTAFQNGGLLTTLVTFMYKAAFKRVKKVFFENTENRDILVEKGIIEKSRTCCLNGAGVNLEDYPFAAYPNDGTTRFLFIGRVMKEKGVEELFKAAKRLKAEQADIAIDIVGPFEEHYEDAVNTLDKAGIIKYHGYQTDVKPFIRQAHCFILPSYHEGMANTLLESGAMGRPLITSNVHGCLEAVDDGKNGYLCKVKDSADLYNKMKQFINLSYEQKVRMGKCSHDFIAARFDKKKVVEDTIREINAAY